MKNKEQEKKKEWIKPQVSSIPFKDTRSGPFIDVVEDATYSVPS